MGKDVIIACDFAQKQEVFEFLELFTEEKPYVKIGMEMFYAEGPEIVREIKRKGHRIFLDLKLARYSEYCDESDACFICAGNRYVQCSCRRHCRNDGSGAERIDAQGWKPSSSDCSNAANFHRSSADGKRTLD